MPGRLDPDEREAAGRRRVPDQVEGKLGLGPDEHAARAVGVSDRRIIFRHILPNAVSPIIVYTTLSIAGVIVGEAFVDYLGYGVDPSKTPTWGNILTAAQDFIIVGNWWWALFPGLAIVLTVLGINFMGDGLRDALDPRSRE